MDRFQQLLYDLGDLFEIPLYAEQNQKCRISINEELEVQLEYDGSKEKVLIATYCCEIPPGKFRENVLKETLKANGIFPRIGTYGYSEEKNKLALFEYVFLENLNSNQFADILAKFIDRATRVKKAIERGTPALLLEVSSEYNKSAFEL
ncbi:MAG: CesT family type III secretion system chaperone [Chlamydiota bacterium]